MPSAHSKATIMSMAIVTTGLTVLLHEGVGHGATSWLRGVPVPYAKRHPDPQLSAWISKAEYTGFWHGAACPD